MSDDPICTEAVDHRGRKYRCGRPKGHSTEQGHEAIETTDDDGRTVLMRWVGPLDVDLTTRRSVK